MSQLPLVTMQAATSRLRQGETFKSIRDSDGTLLCKIHPATGEVEIEVRRHGRRLRRVINPRTMEVAEMRST